MKAKKRGKRTGLRGRSKNARKAKISKPMVKRLGKLVTDIEKYVTNQMYFRAIEDGPPGEGMLILVRLADGYYRHGIVVGGFFAAFDHHNEQFVTFAHPERITHWMEIIPPVPAPVVQAEASSPEIEEFIAQPTGDEPPEPYDLPDGSPNPDAPDTVYS